MRRPELVLGRGEGSAALDRSALRLRLFEVATSHAAEAAAVWLLPFLFVLTLAFDNGGYYPTAWNWSALILLFLSAVILVLRLEVRIGPLESLLPGTLLALALWGVASATWSASFTQPFLESQEILAYAAAVFAALLLVRPRSYRALLAGTWAAITLSCVYALLTRFFPERYGYQDSVAGYRLEQPLGYWNSLGLLAVMGVLVALGLVARSRSLVVRMIAAASTVVLVLTLYFTFSRGAWISLGVALLAVVVLDPRRLELTTVLLAVAPWSAFAIWRASGTELAHVGGGLAASEHAGHHFLPFVLAMAVSAAATILVYTLLQRRLRIPRVLRTAYAVLLILCVVAGLATVIHRYGSPDTIARKAYHNLVGYDTGAGSKDLNQRLFSLGLGQRIPQWKVAWREYRTHPLLGSGLGSYERYWNQYRNEPFQVLNVHNLYLETLTELGPLGLGLLVLALSTPLVAAVMARRRTLVPAATGAYVAFLAHVAVDWDWQILAVGLAALFCGVALLAANRVSNRARRLPSRWRVAALSLVVVLGGLTFVGLRGNNAIAGSEAAYSVRNFTKSAADARAARFWAPWSATPWQLLGQAQAQLGRRAAARASFRHALAKDSADWRLWLDLAVASTGAARRHSFAVSLKLNPLSPEIASWLPSKGSG
jgi:O-antigen ligase